MSLQILQAIGDAINDLNPAVFDTYHVNGIQLTDGRVIRLDDTKEKQYIGISDHVGTSFYIRSNPDVTVLGGGRKLSSFSRPAQENKVCRLVAFTFKPQDDENYSEALCNKLKTDLSKIQFQSIAGNRPVITVKKSNSHYIDNFITECQKQFRSGEAFICVSVDFEVKYTAAECDTCEPVDPDSIYVLIINDGTEEIIARKLPPSEYRVLVVSEIDGGGPDSEYNDQIIDAGTP